MTGRGARYPAEHLFSIILIVNEKQPIELSEVVGAKVANVVVYLVDLKIIFFTNRAY